MRQGQDAPPPNSYKIRGQFDRWTPMVGKSFGVPHSAYAKVYIPESKNAGQGLDAPGPGTYDSRGAVGVNSRKYSMKSRVKVPDSSTRDNPPPNTYHPNFDFTEDNKFQAITFGFGNRCNVTGSKVSHLNLNRGH